MANILDPNKVKLFAGLLFADENALSVSQDLLEKSFGKISYRSLIFGFDFTDYYEKEMGRGLKKLFVGFENPVEEGSLALIKRQTIEIEKKIALHSDDGSLLRQVNIDPGYIDKNKIVLASTKNRSQRIYLSDGIYGEITLQISGKKFEALPWTYPDYQTPISQEFFLSFRDL